MKSLSCQVVKMMNVKLLLVLLAFTVITCTAAAQNKVTPAPTEDKKADPNKRDACFPGGMDGFYSYIASQVKLDSSCTPGRRVMVSFMVDKKGKVRRAKINEHVLSDKMNAQLVKIFESAPTWEPAKQNGHELREHFVCPIIFMPKVDLIAANTTVKK